MLSMLDQMIADLQKRRQMQMAQIQQLGQGPSGAQTPLQSMGGGAPAKHRIISGLIGGGQGQNSAGLVSNFIGALPSQPSAGEQANALFGAGTSEKYPLLLGRQSPGLGERLSSAAGKTWDQSTLGRAIHGLQGGGGAAGGAQQSLWQKLASAATSLLGL